MEALFCGSQSPPPPNKYQLCPLLEQGKSGRQKSSPTGFLFCRVAEETNGRKGTVSRVQTSLSNDVSQLSQRECLTRLHCPTHNHQQPHLHSTE